MYRTYTGTEQARNKRESGSAIPRGPHPISIFRGPHHFRAKNIFEHFPIPHISFLPIFEVSLSLKERTIDTKRERYSISTDRHTTQTYE